MRPELNGVPGDRERGSMSQKPIINSIDLNLLKVMHAIATTRQVTAAGDMIGLSQPAVSHALKRLRTILKDDLFIRTGYGLQMTSACASLMPTVRKILSECEMVFMHSSPFNPATSNHAFRIGMNDYFSIVLMPPLVETMNVVAPNCLLQVTHMPRTPGSAQSPKRPLVQNFLDEGEIDIAVMTADKFPARFICEPLFAEERVCITSSTNPVNATVLTLERLLAMRHVKITSDPSRRGWIDEQLDGMKKGRRVVATVPHFSAAVAIVSKTDLVAVMPKSVALHFKDAFALTLHQLPFPHTPQSTSMIYLKDREKETSISWLLEHIRNCFSES